jgi:MFS family permease
MTDGRPLGAGRPSAPSSQRRNSARDWARRNGAAAARALEALFGGPARTRVILLLAAVLALNSADTATVGASATQLRAGLHISNADIGLLVAVTAVAVAVFSIPFGVLVDRVHRTGLLSLSVIVWGAIMLYSASVTSLNELLVARVALGAATASTGPGVASLVGDYFPGEERGKIYGFVLAGELLGAGVGFVISGNVASLSWRAAFVILAIPTFALAGLLARLPEPARGGASQLLPGAVRIRGRREAAARANRVSEPAAGEGAGTPATPTDAQALARRRQIPPHGRLILREDPAKMGIVRTIRYVLAIRTNVVLILSSAVGYFFLAGIETFGLEFAKGQYHVAQIVATLLLLVVGAGAVLGMLVGGRLGDNLLRRGQLNGRVVVALAGALVTPLLFIPAFITHSVVTAVPYLTFAGFTLTVQEPPIDAARLDIMPPLLWGRAEGVRSFMRTAAQALAPLTFGGLADLVGLQVAFAVMLVPFLGSGVILVWALRTYPRDVATAGASAAAARSEEPPARPLGTSPAAP